MRLQRIKKMDVTFVFNAEFFVGGNRLPWSRKHLGYPSTKKEKILNDSTKIATKLHNKKTKKQIGEKQQKKICIKMTNIRFYHFPFIPEG